MPPMYAVYDSTGKRMTLPRKYSGQAIDVLVRGILKGKSTPRERRTEWMRLKSLGYEVKPVEEQP